MDLSFKISSGLKDIIGRDLITDDYVAIFELVKNSFDAGATVVDIAILDDAIIISDNGKGMSEEDVSAKWLFVAYSAKRDGTEDTSDYREKIDARPYYAGSKGIGRFSCDRLGETLILQSRTHSSSSVVSLTVNWADFEQDSKLEFYEIPVKLSKTQSFVVKTIDTHWTKNNLKNIFPQKSGTVLVINNLRSPWNRSKLIDLHTHLAKLISPFREQQERFRINVHAPRELDADLAELEKFKEKESVKKVTEVDLEPPIPINGPVNNFVFSSLAPRTTVLEVCIRSHEGHDWIESTLTDRGRLVYRIREKNNFGALSASEFQCSLFYLNQASKNVFKRRMGVRSVSFGSVFLFRNGFRVYPIGEEGRDDFGIDRRKQQGYARYLGTRDLIGRIEVQGTQNDFREASSRDQGLIKTVAYEQLSECFTEFCLKRLERYVTGISWSDSLDKEYLDPSRLETSPMRLKIIDLLAGFASDAEIDILDFGKDIFEILSSRADEAGLSIASLRKLAESVGDRELLLQVEKAQKRLNVLSQSERQAKERAEAERVARERAETKAAEASKAAKKIESAYEEERKRNLFLISQTSVDKNVVIDLHHQITIYSSNLHHLIQAELRELKSGNIDPTRSITALSDMSLCNEQILAASRLATRANFRLDSEEIEDDLATYFSEYTSRVCSVYQNRVQVEVFDKKAASFIRQFKPIDVSIIIDNLVTNADIAGAPAVRVSLTTSKDLLEVLVEDDGPGISVHVEEHERIFERGFTTTTGSGLGLYHVKEIVEGLGGEISIVESSIGGAAFRIRIPK